MNVIIINMLVWLCVAIVSPDAASAFVIDVDCEYRS